jgi:WD domain, G-beta repeat
MTPRARSAAALGTHTELNPGGGASNPFPGLRPFGKGEAHLFFGRERHIEALLARLKRQRLLAVVGTSGSGKSSLVLAGVLPRLHRGYRTESGAAWRVATLRPGSDPIANLAAALQVVSHQEDDEAAYHELAEESAERMSGTQLQVAERDASQQSALQRDLIRAELERGPSGLHEAVRSFGLDPGENLLLVVDQFEELFRFRALMRSELHDAATAFVRLLLTSAAQREVPVYIMLTMRSDFLGDCVRFPGLAEALNEGQYLVPLLRREQRADAIRGPIGVAGAAISNALAQRLLNDAGEIADQLPVLQHALMRTFELARNASPVGEQVRLELAHYEAAGGVAGALSSHADEAYAEVAKALGKEGERVTERLFRCLTDRGEHGQGVRRPCTVAEVLDVAATDLPTLGEVMRRFVAHGFLLQQPAGPLAPETTLDISHESLMRQWGRLCHWTSDESDFARRLQALEQARREHAENARSLLRDPELSLALKWQTEQRPTARAAQRYAVDLEAAISFLRQSQRANRLRKVALWGAVLLVIAGLSVLGLKLDAKNRELKAETSKAKLALAEAKTATRVSLAAEWSDDSARAAVSLREAVEPAAARGRAWSAAASSVAKQSLSVVLKGHTGSVYAASFSGDGSRIVTASDDKTARVWQSDSGKLVAELRGHTGSVYAASFSGDGSRIVTASFEKNGAGLAERFGQGGLRAARAHRLGPCRVVQRRWEPHRDRFG